MVISERVGEEMNQRRKLQVGDCTTTDFNGAGTITQVTITARKENSGSQSGIMYQVSPRLKNSLPDAWFDSDWFEKK